MKKKHSKKTDKQLKIAEERIVELFSLAENGFKNNPALSNRYITLARKISMKYKVKIPAELKRRFCKYCYSYLFPGINCRVRLNNDKIIYTCFKCKNFIRFPYKKRIINKQN
ncbi:MAG: ribonuclease P protein component 4 [Candidatus Woesearchaeota archaeon]